MGQEPPTSQFDPAATDLPSENSRDGARKRRDPSEPAAVIGIGASAGGIAPLQQFFEGIAPDSGLAFVVVMHLSPDFESQLASVLQQKTSMPVVQVNEPVKVQPNHVYVIPPNHQLTFEDSMLRLVPPQQAQGRRVTIDLFFRTLAFAYGQRAVAIIMSGTDSDGVIGLKHVRAQGGVTIAQEPEEAEFDSMPLSAIGTGMVDWVLPVGEMPPRLLEFVKNEHAMHLPPEIEDAAVPDAKADDAPGGETISDETEDSDDEEALLMVLKHLRAQTHHDFSHYKRATILRRIARRLQVNSIESIPTYLEFLRRRPAEVRALLHDLLIGVTHFFRDQGAFAALDGNVPQLFAGKNSSDELRVWVAGCATGEEAYSIAMLLSEQAEKLNDPPSLQVFATDIDEQSIHDAREGLYPPTIEADVSQERLRRFFLRDNGRYRVKKEIRDKVLFAAHNVLNDPAFSRVDLVSCRNLLIYLNRKAQERVFDVFHFALRPGGLLFIGGSESADSAHTLFSPLDTHHRIYVRRSVPRPGWKIPLIPQRIRAPRFEREQADAPMLLRMAAGEIETAGEHSQSSTYEGQQRRSVLFGELHLKLLEEYGPPSVVVNESHDIVHLSENAGRYLTFRAGEASTNLLTVVNPALRVELRTALFRAAQSNESVIVPAQRVEIEGETQTIDLHVRPIRPGDSAHGFFLVLFEEKIEPLTAREEAVERETISRQVGNELQSLKEQLNATVEQFEASSEELKASNEELQAMNEELRSAAEELETSKEELQSVNEELITVNQELKEKIEELSHANSDLNNLMAATDLASIFLDRALRVVRFTPRIQETFNLLPSDIGRPISDITHKLRYDSLIGDAERVLEHLAPVEREIETQDDRSFLTRIAPYRTVDDRISGVVVTLIDVTLIKRVQTELRSSENRLRVLADAIPQIVWTNSSDGTANYFNQRWYAFTGLTYEESLGPGWQAVVHRDDAGAKGRWLDAFHAGEVFEAEFRLRAADGKYRWFISRNVPLKDAEGRAISWFGTATDIHDLKETEAALRESEERFRQFGENSADVLWIIDARTRQPEYVSPAFEKIWGVSLDTIQRGVEAWTEMLHPDDRDEMTAALEELFTGKSLTREYRIVRPDNGATRWVRDVGFPIRDGSDRVVRIAGIVQDITSEREQTERMRATEERFNLLVEGTPDYAMFLLDRENVITYWSKGAERVFGWSAEEAVGQTGEIIFTPEDRARNEDDKEITTALRDGRAPDQRWHERKDGSRLWVDGIMRRLDDENGKLRGFAKVARDATEQHNSEEELRRAHEELEQRVYDRTRELQTMNETLEAEMQRRQQLEQEVLQVTERERARISQDLHDSLCQELTATAFFLKSTAKTVDKESATAADSLRQAAETVNDNAGLARDLARGLHPLELGTAGLVSALRELASRTNERVSCRCECPRSLRVPNEAVAVNLYRIAQEAVTNALKHSQCSEIVICIERAKSEIVMSVTNDGKSIHERRGKRGMGVHMMHYRASASGGTLTVENRRGGGMKVTCRVPARQ